MANFYPALMQQVFHVSERKWEPNVQHHSQSDDLWTGFEIAEGVGCGHFLRPGACSTQL